MKLSKLYSNHSNVFVPIYFNEGFNVIYGEIKHPENQKLDTHNLGKTTFAKVLDFSFLVEKEQSQFFFKHFEKFKSFVFFLELVSKDGRYLTIKRGVERNTKISFKTHSKPHQDFTQLPDNEWDHLDMAIGKAKIFLEGWLNFDVLKNWQYRKLFGYLIRTQSDFDMVFRLNKHRGKDIDWKPYMADLLGFNGGLATKYYQKQSEVFKIDSQIAFKASFDIKNINKELSKIDNMLLLRKNDLTNMQLFIDEFNFDAVDQKTIEHLIGVIDSQISEQNIAEYTIKNNIARVEQSLEVDKISFDTEEVKSLFVEANILFPNQLTKDFNQLIKFNKDITKERNKYLKAELGELNKALVSVRESLTMLNKTRSDQMGFLAETELISKFKKSNQEVVEIQTEISILNQQKEIIENILSLEEQKAEIENEINVIKHQMQDDVNHVNKDTSGIFAKVRIYFNDIINRVLNKEGSITVYLNSNGNFEFRAEFQDKRGNDTSESDGNTYQKFLCIAFDLAVARAYLDKNFPKFLYIDGVFDGLDNRKKNLILEILHEYSNLGLQIIITTISSEVEGLSETFAPEDIILTLHDDGQAGRLFKMATW